MSIDCPIKFTVVTDAEFGRLDYQVMKHVFASHNELGRLCDEPIYQNDLAVRLAAADLGPVLTEVPVTVNWRGFRKIYYLDLVVNDALLYELKTAVALAGEHKTQLLNYVLLLALHTGKLLNFRTPKIETWFGSSTLTEETRRRIEYDTSRWRELTSACADCQAALREILTELGAFLDIALYQEMLIWFLGGAEKVIHRVPLVRDGIVLGTQRSYLLAEDVAFCLTAHADHIDHAEGHLRRFLNHTQLRALQWINFNHTQIAFITLSRNIILTPSF